MPNLVGIKKKMVPSDLISQPNSPPACTALSFAIRVARCCPFRSQPPSFESSGSMRPGSPAGFPAWNRYLEAAFHSPETIVRLRTTISRSTFPTYFFDALPSDRRARSVSDSLARSGSPRCTQDRYRKPVARLTSGSHDRSSDLHFPLGSSGPIRIKAFNPIPGRKVHLLNTLDCPSLPGYEPIY
jgi:hypothetical protein